MVCGATLSAYPAPPHPLGAATLTCCQRCCHSTTAQLQPPFTALCSLQSCDKVLALEAAGRQGTCAELGNTTSSSKITAADGRTKLAIVSRLPACALVGNRVDCGMLCFFRPPRGSCCLVGHGVTDLPLAHRFLPGPLSDCFLSENVVCVLKGKETTTFTTATSLRD